MKGYNEGKKLIVLFLFSASVVYTAPLPLPSGADAGVLLNQTKEIFRQQKLSKDLKEEKLKERKGIEAGESQKLDESKSTQITFKLNGININKSEVLTEEEINNIINRYVGKDIGVNDLYTIVNELNKLYEEKGYAVCKAGLPPQTISDGYVRIMLIEGKTGDISVSGNNSTREGYIKKRINLKPGEISNLKELNKSLIWFNGTNDIQMRIEMEAGKAVGTTDYILNVYEPKKHNYFLFADNLGSKTSGEYRAGIGYTNNSLTGHRDQLSITGMGAEGNKTGGLSYSFPIGSRGTKIGMQYSIGRVEIIDGELKDVNVKGESSSYGVSITRPLVVNEKRKIEASLEWSKQNSTTDIMGYEWVNDDISHYGIGLAITSYGNNSVLYSKSTIWEGNWKSLSETSKDYTKYEMLLMYQKAFQSKKMLTVRFNGQYAFDDYLPSADQFYVGGAYSVRGYEENFMGADSGMSLSTELSIPAWKNGEFFLFLDGGMTYGENAWDDNIIYGTGCGYKMTIKEKTSVALTLGIPLVKDINNAEVDSSRINFTFSHQF